MIEVSELLSFFRRGEMLCGIALDTSKQDVLDRFGSVLTVYGDRTVGYLELPEGIRFGYWNDTIDELAVLNERVDVPYTFQIDSEKIYLGSNTTFNDVVRLLDSQSIKWKQLNLTHKFERYLLTEGFVGFMFDKETEKLRIISQTNQTKQLHRGEFHL